MGALFFTHWSLVGFWTDYIVAGVLAVAAVGVVFVFTTGERRSNLYLRGAVIVLMLLVGRMYWGFFGEMFFMDKLKTRSFYYHRVDGRIFHAYFRPVGAYSGGQGEFWITESPAVFPVIERPVYYEHAVRWDFRADSVEGEPVNNAEVVDQYIRENVTRK
jgi:hypothetical protein